MPTANPGQQNLESGFLLRIRSWRDALPWLCLLDALRPATSLVSWILVAAALLCSTLFSSYVKPSASTESLSEKGSDPLEANRFHGFLDRAGEGQTPFRIGSEYALPTGTSAAEQSLFVLFQEPLKPLLELFWPTLHLANSATSKADAGLMFLCQSIVAALWVVPACFIMRQSMLAMGGRFSMGTFAALRLIARRILSAINCLLIPALLYAMTILLLWCINLLGVLPVVGPWLALPLHLLAFPVLCGGALLAAASIAAIPLAWGAIAGEEDASSFSAVSRGYEYVLRRPLQLVMGIVVGVLVLEVVFYLATWLLLFARRALVLSSVSGPKSMSPSSVSPTGLSPSSLNIMQALLEQIPSVLVLTCFWSLIAWLYLLLRRSANHQEIEDLWEPPAPPAQALPRLDL